MKKRGLAGSLKKVFGPVRRSACSPIYGKGQRDPQMGEFMTVHLAVQPVLTLEAGRLILVVPRLLNSIVAGYLILLGIVGLVG